MLSGDFPFRKVAILGTGLMGGSLAGALKALPVPPEVIGTTVSSDDRVLALERGWVDRFADSNESAVAGVDLAVIAVPPQAVPRVWGEIVGPLPPSAIVTDLSSVKGSLYELYRTSFSALLPLYTSSHPMAGSERTGIASARSDLFSGRTVFLTPFGSEKNTLLPLVRLWQALGANTVPVSPADHDGIVAHISHLPHALSYCLLNLAEKVRQENRYPGFDWKTQKGGSFSDILRIAKSSPELWADIFFQNRTAILDAIESFDREMGVLRETLRRGEPGTLVRLLSEWTAPLSGGNPP
ncbi:MAG: prephenate dehydrogenase [Nitrospirae bacterium]|nr:MAG: Prephenate dehydrogenase [Leptospirillum sp. Group IV 'UBA BS']MCL4485345.1 prephenate dehydrogenase [Nitrospirota bacterium]MCL5285089.1 prephenate dehydrogenase [Nitrospirota bacterium]